VLKFSKYLPSFGWQAQVVTANPPAHATTDPSLSAEIPDPRQVHRTNSLALPLVLPWRVRDFIRRWFFISDEQKLWKFSTYPTARKIAAGSVQLIISSSAPYVTHEIGLKLKQSHPLPWIADFRDPWIGNSSNRFPTNWHSRKAAAIEKQVVEHADSVTVVSPQMRNGFISRYPNLPAEKFHVIPNGYDPADFSAASPIQKSEYFTLTYAGTLYGARYPAIEALMTAIRLALQEGRVSARHIHIRLVGNLGRDIHPILASTGLTDMVTQTGYLTHQLAIAEICSADLNLLLIGIEPGSDGVFTGKIFEYLAAGKPILALAPPGAAADLITRSQAGSVVDPQDVDQIAHAVVRYYRQWLDGIPYTRVADPILSQFSRVTLSRQLAELCDSLI
jgi:glycosyltransferase involved in cell wall biosynthesis